MSKIKNNLKIRNCNYKEDLDYIISKRDDLYEYNIGNKYNPTNKFKNFFLLDILKNKGKKNSKIFILELNKKSIGYIQILIKKNQKIQQKNATITRIYINEKYRGKGYGKMLIETAIEFIKNKNVNSINLNSYITNSKFYEKLGFKVEAYSMRKDLK